MHKKKISIIFMCLLVFLLALNGCGKKNSEKETEKGTQAEKKTQKTTEDETDSETEPVLVDNKLNCKIVFNLTIPEPLEDGYYITIGCDILEWNPMDTTWELEKEDDLHYKYTMDLSKLTDCDDLIEKMQDGKMTIQYKWTLQKDGLAPVDAWSMIELDSKRRNVSSRGVVVSTGENVFDDEIEAFKKYDEKVEKTDSVVGQLVLEDIATDGLLSTSSRTVRVWLPEGYDQNDTTKKYPVLYMHDGQNLFDSVTSFAGEWGVDEIVSNEMKKGYEGCIVVGIDSVSDTRMDELSPSFIKGNDGTEIDSQGDRYAKFIVDKVKPYIDSKYNTKSDQANTGIGGSSMGGVMSFYMGLEYNDVFGFEVCFSPALVYWTDQSIESYVKDCQVDKLNNPPKLYIYAGGVGTGTGMGNDESALTRYPEYLKKMLVKDGYPEDCINTYVDPESTHNEDAWRLYFKPAFEWLVGISDK